MNNSIEIDESYLLSFEIDYNFENNEFSDFTIKQIPFNTDYIMGNYYYTDGVMYFLNYSEDDLYDAAMNKAFGEN